MLEIFLKVYSEINNMNVPVYRVQNSSLCDFLTTKKNAKKKINNLPKF